MISLLVSTILVLVLLLALLLVLYFKVYKRESSVSTVDGRSWVIAIEFVNDDPDLRVCFIRKVINNPTRLLVSVPSKDNELYYIVQFKGDKNYYFEYQIMDVIHATQNVITNMASDMQKAKIPDSITKEELESSNQSATSKIPNENEDRQNLNEGK